MKTHNKIHILRNFTLVNVLSNFYEIGYLKTHNINPHLKEPYTVVNVLSIFMRLVI